MRFIILISVIVLSSKADSQVNSNNKFSLTGKVVGEDTGYVHIGYFNSSGKYVNDSCYLKNGKFEFLGSITEPTRASFYGKRKSRSVNDPNWTEIFIEPVQMQAIFNIDKFKKAIMTGSKTQDEFSIYNQKIDSLENNWKIVFDKLSNATTIKDTVEIEKIKSEQLPQYRKEIYNLTLKFIKKFPSSSVSAYVLGNQTQRLTIDSLKMFYSSLAPEVKKSFYGKGINDFIVKTEKLEIGMLAPDFRQLDSSGNIISLENFKGKYVLLDFWASWCIPCREENPYLKQAYFKYHDKGFTIISFSLDKIEERNEWIGALKKDNLPWIQLCDFKGWGGEVVNEYNLYGKGIPANFLINPKGQIIAKDLRGDQIEKKISELFR